MEFLKERFLTRIENFLEILNNVKFMIEGEISSMELDADNLVKIDNEEDVTDYVSFMLTKYVIAICNDDDLSKRRVPEYVEHSVECQRLVEQDCNEVYASRLAQVFKNLMASNLSLHAFDNIVNGDLFTNSETNRSSSSGEAGDNSGGSRAPGDASFSSSSEESAENGGETDDKSGFRELFRKLDIQGEKLFEDVEPRGMVYSKTEVSELLKIRPCRLVLEFISDSPFDYPRITAPRGGDAGFKGNFVGINYKTHANAILRRFAFFSVSVSPLRSEMHVDYLKGYLTVEGEPRSINLGYLNCSRPWIVYWALHSLSLLGEDVSVYRQRSINSLSECWDHELGGFGGGVAQRGHLATTYAALCVLKMLDALDVVDSKKLYSFLMDMKIESGAFKSTYGGEYDTRSTYCGIASAHIMGILDEKLARNTAEFLADCQTYEGGIAAEPDLEAHAGYTYCGLASLSILNKMELLDLESLYYWVISRVTSQFGFQGRPHKLVDVCYSFWIGASIQIVEDYVRVNGIKGMDDLQEEMLGEFTRSRSHDREESDSEAAPKASSEVKNGSEEVPEEGGGSVVGDDRPGSGVESVSSGDGGGQEQEHRAKQLDVQGKEGQNSPRQTGSGENERSPPKAGSDPKQTSARGDRAQGQEVKEPHKVDKGHSRARGAKGKSRGGGERVGKRRMFEKLLRCYILVVSQAFRGFRDKPNKPPDLYHTCYALSYLNIISPIINHRHDILLNVLEI